MTLKESDSLVPIKFLDTYEEFEHWTPFAYSTHSENNYLGSPAYSTSTFTMLCKLSITMSDILGCIYNEHSFNQSPQQLSKLIENLHSKLVSWRKSLPEHLNFHPAGKENIPPPHVLSLQYVESPRGGFVKTNNVVLCIMSWLYYCIARSLPMATFTTPAERYQ